MRWVFRPILVLSVVLLGLVALQNWQGSEREGELVFTPESLDAGQLPLGQTAIARFEVRNAGGKPVAFTVSQVKAVEGC